jgi:ABC-type transport system substrate-binding protein
MNCLFLIILFFTVFPAGAQNVLLRKKVDGLVHQIDIAKGNSFVCQISSNSYQYKLVNDKLAMITRQFRKGNIKTEQSFYLNEGSLIFSTENETTFFEKDTTGIGWGGVYYFDEDKLKDYETLGHGKSENETWKPEPEVLANFKKARKEVSSCINKKRRS